MAWHSTAWSPRGLRVAPAHRRWDSIGVESAGSFSKSQALPELDSLTAGSSKNCIFQKLDPLSARSSFESWILQELDPPRAGSSEHQILL